MISNRLFLLVTLLVAFGWRAHALTYQSLWRDEVDAIYFAVRALPDTLSMFISAGQNGPLYFLSLRPWFQWVGTHEFSLRYPSVMAGVLSVALLWQVARRLLSKWHHQPKGMAGTKGRRLLDVTPLLAAIFLALNPYQLWYSQEGKMYALVVCLALLSSYCWLRGMERGGWRHWLAYLIVTSLSLYIHLLMILLIPLHLLWFWIAWPQGRARWRGYGGALAGLTLPYLPMVWWQWNMLISTKKETGFTFTPLDSILQTLLLNHSRGFMPPGDLLWLAPIFFLGLAGLLMGLGEMGRGEMGRDEMERSEGGHSEMGPDERDDPAPIDDNLAENTPSHLLDLSGRRRFLLIITWLIVPILSIYGLSLRQPIFVDRYVIWVAPAAMMLLALGLRVLWNNSGLLARPLTYGFILYLLSFWLYAGWTQKTQPMKYDLRSAVNYIVEHRQPDDQLILQIPHMVYSYRYYSSNFEANPFAGSDSRLGNWFGGLWTNNGFPDEKARVEVAQLMLNKTIYNQTNDVAYIWVLGSEIEMWDSRRLMDAWLETHGTLADEANFHGTQVRRYALQPNEQTVQE